MLSTIKYKRTTFTIMTCWLLIDDRQFYTLVYSSLENHLLKENISTVDLFLLLKIMFGQMMTKPHSTCGHLMMWDRGWNGAWRWRRHTPTPASGPNLSWATGSRHGTQSPKYISNTIACFTLYSRYKRQIIFLLCYCKTIIYLFVCPSVTKLK